MRALNLKVVRDLWHMRGQALAVSIVIAAGVAVLIMAQSTQNALIQSSQAYYDRYRFGDVFGTLKRAPEHVADRIAQIPGVSTVQTRVVKYAMLDIQAFNEPATGQLVSLPSRGEPKLNKIVLRAGRWPLTTQLDEVIVNEPFADAHNLQPGDHITAILNGHRRILQIVGIGLSPEFIYSLAPGGLMPDDQRFGVVWANAATLEAAYDLEGAFNHVALKLMPGFASAPVVAQLDQVLERYGGIGAVSREHQISNWFVQNEIQQQATMSRVLPTIFLIVAAFLTNIVMQRLMHTQRGQIGLMKAFGYTNWEIAAHFAKIVTGIAAAGIIIGLILGRWLGYLNTEIYADLFRFPLMVYSVDARAFAIAAGLSLAATLMGAMQGVRQAIRLPPALAMQPPAPPVFHNSRLLQTAAGRWLDQPTRIILRNVMRAPRRAGTTALGLAASIALLVMAQQWTDCLDYLAQSYFFDAQRQDVTLAVSETQSVTAIHSFTQLPGVMATEPARIVSADFKSGPIVHRGAINGVSARAWLQPVYDERRQAAQQVPDSGLILSKTLADKLRVQAGDKIWLKILEGRRPLVQVPVVDTIETYIGTPAFMHINSLNRLMHESPRFGYVHLLVDPQQSPALYQELKQLPAISSVIIRQSAIDSFYAIVAENSLVFINIFSGLACAMGFGVAYNSARITLSERGRELATLRVLGFTQGEVSYILLGEVALLMVIALPLGCVLGNLLSRTLVDAFATELFRIPMVIEPSTYGTAVCIALLATLCSGYVVQRRVDSLDLIEVLKTRE